MITWAFISFLKSEAINSYQHNGDMGCALAMTLLVDSLIAIVIGQVIIKLWGC